MIRSVSISTLTLTPLQAERRAWKVLVNYLGGPVYFFYSLHVSYWLQQVSRWMPKTNFGKQFTYKAKLGVCFDESSANFGDAIKAAGKDVAEQ